jgi:hypothetical protein
MIKVAVGVASCVTAYFAVAIFIWLRKRRAISMNIREIGDEILDTEHTNGKHEQLDSAEQQNLSSPTEVPYRDRRREDLPSILFLSAPVQGEEPGLANSTTSNSREGSRHDLSKESLPFSLMEELQLPSSNIHAKSTSSRVDAKRLHIRKAITARRKNHSHQVQYSHGANTVILSAPDPARKVIRAQQQWMLDKNTAEHAQRLADAEAAAATSATPSGTSNVTEQPQVPEDYELLRARVVMLQRRIEEMTAAMNQGRETDELPPEYRTFTTKGSAR